MVAFCVCLGFLKGDSVTQQRVEVARLRTLPAETDGAVNTHLSIRAV